MLAIQQSKTKDIVIRNQAGEELVRIVSPKPHGYRRVGILSDRTRFRVTREPTMYAPKPAAK
jgi:hypothetical protein